MTIYQTYNIAADENTFYVENEQAVLVIDPGSDWLKIEDKLTQLNKPVAAILLTHAHFDHIMSVDLIREQFNQPPVYVSELEADWLGDPAKNLSNYFMPHLPQTVSIAPADHYFVLRQTYHLAGFQFDVVPTPGHSIGGVSIIFHQQTAVFTGDALFREHVGRSDLPTSDRQALLNGVRQELFTLPENYTVYPGHGDNSTIGHEKRYNPHFN